MKSGHNPGHILEIPDFDQRKAYNSWYEAASERKEQMRKLRAAASGLRNMELKKGYNAWHESASEQGEQKRKLLSAVRTTRPTSLAES